jgi:hypothetical protein
MVGLLPEQVRLRRKTPLGHPVHALLQRTGRPWMKDFTPLQEMGKYVRWDSVPGFTGATPSPDEAEISLRPFSLNYWLCCMGRSGKI